MMETPEVTDGLKHGLSKPVVHHDRRAGHDWNDGVWLKRITRYDKVENTCTRQYEAC